MMVIPNFYRVIGTIGLVLWVLDSIMGWRPVSDAQFLVPVCFIWFIYADVEEIKEKLEAERHG